MQADHDQLKKELDSYHQHKPVRERQTADDAAEQRRRRPIMRWLRRRHRRRLARRISESATAAEVRYFTSCM